MYENCGNQVSETQIKQEMTKQTLSQIECEYNADQLKRKLQGKAKGKHIMEDERLFELYSLGFNTLKALTNELRLEKEWHQSIKPQYAGVIADGNLNETSRSIVVDPEDTVKLLTRCKKMYEAKNTIQIILKLIVERTQMIEFAHVLIRVSDETQTESQRNAKKSLDKIDRLSIRITSQINTL